MQTITFSVQPIDVSENQTDDPGVTCIFCGLYKCTHEILVLGDGRRVWCGMHERCGERHAKRLREMFYDTR